MTTIQDAPRYASPVDYEAYGEYGPGRGFERGQSFRRPRYRFQGRITADGSSGYQAEPGPAPPRGARGLGRRGAEPICPRAALTLVRHSLGLAPSRRACR